MGYRNDSFYNLKDDDGRSGPYMGADTASNAHFNYPPKNIRFLAAEEQLKGTPNPNDYKIQRGYIRGLQQPGVTGGAFQPLKCSFQFNPQQITQIVSMREDVYLPIMQDPIQFTQPFGAMTNFNFDLLFDRSREVAAGNYFTDTGGLAAYLRDNGSVAGDQYTAADRDNLKYKSDVRDIGAMADLQVLYSIIGQGFSQETLKFQAARLRQAGVTQINKDGGVDTTDPNAINAGNIDSKVDAYINPTNIGNSAFLIPNPVRVIFSSMFMVDGFITGTAVDFLKFSTTMVPLQIRVGLTMNAMYIGFAREKTFLTEQLAQQAAQLKEQAAQDAAAGEELTKAADDILDSFGYALRNNDTGSTIENSANGSGLNVGGYSPIYQWAFENGGKKGDSWERNMHLGYIPKDRNVRPEDFAEDHTFSYKWWFTVWGPTTQAEANKIRTAKGSGYNNLIVGNYAGSDTSANGFSQNGWAKVLTGYTSLSNGSANRLRHSTTSNTVYTNATTGKYYATKFSVEITVTTNSNGNAITRTGNQDVWKVLAAEDKSYSKFKINWGTTGNRATPGQNNLS
jgi:hypothetical protein